jgi:hypothetical protein
LESAALDLRMAISLYGDPPNIGYEDSEQDFLKAAVDDIGNEIWQHSLLIAALKSVRNVIFKVNLVSLAKLQTFVRNILKSRPHLAAIVAVS